MTEYELVVLYHPDLEIDLQAPKAKVTKIINDAGGSIKAEESWGKRKLAYNIAGNEYAVYELYTVEMPGTSVVKVENALNIADEVLRYLVTKIDRKAIEKAEKVKAAKAARRKNDNKDSDSVTAEQKTEQ